MITYGEYSMATKRVLKTEECKGQEIILSDYTHLRAYHACRPENIQTYIHEGLLPFSRETALDDAIRKLVGGRVTATNIRTQFEAIWQESDTSQHSRVWLALEKSELLEWSCHYLIYGSELLNALAMNLGCRDRLKRIGRPTIVVCDVPIEDISSTWLNGLEEALWEGETSMRSIAVFKVEPQNVVNFLYPTGWVNDPYTRMRYKLAAN